MKNKLSLTTSAGVLAIAALLVGSAGAATVTLAPTSVNRVIGGGFDNTHYTDFFSTYSSSIQKTLVETTNVDLTIALAGVLGALGAGESYQINLATLAVGAVSDDYVTIGGRAHTVIVPWDSSDVTYNEADADLNTAWSTPGLASGTDYSATVADTGTTVGLTTEWTSLGSTIQDWVDGTTPNHGLFFPDVGSSANAEFTAVANVSWTLDAEIVPEPTTATLGLLGFLGLLFRRRR